MLRRDDGQPLRDAIKAAGLSIERLAERTKQVDPSGYGISRAAIGHMVSTGPAGRERFEDRSCDLVAKALNEDVHTYFADEGTTGTT